jgi:ABC-type multidrug transport system fused ATPase/permease subunit
VPQNTVLFSGTLWENLVYGLNYISTARVMEEVQEKAQE